MPASASAAQIAYLVESSRGAVPGAGDAQYLRSTGESLNQTVESTSSQEIRNDRMVADAILTAGSLGGGINFEMSHKTYNDFFPAMLAGAIVPLTGSTTNTVTISDATFTGSNGIASALDGIPTNLVVGQWFQIAGSVSNDGIYRCATTVGDGSAITVDPAVKATVLEATPVSVTISSSRVKNGTAALTTFSIEKSFTDITPNQFFMFRGMGVESLNLTYSTGSILTGTWNFVGSQSNPADSVRDTTSQFPDSFVAATTTGVMNSVTGTKVLLDGAAMTGSAAAESFNITVATGLRGTRGLGTGLTFADISVGSFDITGTINLYLDSDAAAVYDKMIAGTPVTLEVGVSDADGNGITLNLPRCKITSSEILAGSINTDVMANFGFTATYDSTTAAMLAIDILGSTA